MRKVAKRAVVKRRNFQGLDLSIEFTKGGKRPYTDDKGNEKTKTMFADYGEIRDTHGLDGDAVDVYVGPDDQSPKVFVITQMKRGDWSKVDEEKCVLGVNTVRQARELYLKHYNDDRFCGAIKELSMDQFKDRLDSRGQHGKKIASAASRIAEINFLRMQQGVPVLMGAQHGVKLAAVDYAAKLQALEARRDPDGIETGTYQPPLQADVDGFLESYYADKHADLDVELSPAFDAGSRASKVPGPDVVRDEQRGLGIPESKIRGNPKDSKMRKAAALARINLFLKEAAAATKKDDSAGHKRLAIGAAAALSGAALGALGGGKALKSVGAKIIPRINKQKAINQIEQQKAPFKKILNKPSHPHWGDELTQKTHAAGEVRKLDSYQRMVKKSPVEDFSAAPEKHHLLNARVGGAVLGGGAGTAAAALGTREKKSGEERAGRIANRMDDVGLGILAAPYVAGGIAKHLKDRPGRLGQIGRAAHAAEGWMEGKKHRLEIAGLGLVAPGITHGLAKHVDRAVPPKPAVPKIAGFVSKWIAKKSLPILEAAGEKVVAPAVRAGRNAMGAGVLLGSAGTAGTLYGANKVLNKPHQHHEPVAPPQYHAARVI